MSIFVVVTSEPYGGGRKVQVFAKRNEADKYSSELMFKNKDVDVIVQERDLFRSCVVSEGKEDEVDESKQFPAIMVGTTTDGQFRVLAREGDFERLELWDLEVGAKPKPIDGTKLIDRGKLR